MVTRRDHVLNIYVQDEQVVCPQYLRVYLTKQLEDVINLRLPLPHLKGASAKAIITGDLTQIDLPKNQKSGLAKALYILKGIDGIAHIELDEEDVVRHRLVKAIIKAYEKDKIIEQGGV